MKAKPRKWSTVADQANPGSKRDQEIRNYGDPDEAKCQRQTPAQQRPQPGSFPDREELQ